MALFLIHALWTPITLVFFVLIARPRANPLADVADALHTGISTRGGKLVLGAGLLITGANFFECLFEPWLASALGYDLTAWVRSVEGDLVERWQAVVPLALVPLLGWFYLSGYLAGLLAPAVVWTVQRDHRAIATLVFAYGANYVLALPFYLFFPVQEVGWSTLSQAVPLMDTVWPGIAGQTRVGSGLDNCFPSLHVSMTCTAFAVALRHGPATLRWLAGAVAVGTGWVVVALGIHWALDVAAGVPFGFLCAFVGATVARRYSR